MLFDHIQDCLLHHYARPWTQTGQHGVTIFFVLSGFLITTKLLESPIMLKQFFVRRFFRLTPVAWAFLAAMLLFDHATHSYFLSWAEVRACLLFYRNFIGVAGGGAAGHFWSLSLEEQFYLVWPAILLFAGIRRCRWIAAVGATACATYRYAFWARYNHNLTDYQTQVRADALLLGCLLALLLTDARVRQFATRWSPYSALPALALLLYCIASFQWLAPLMESIAIAMLMTASLFHPEALWSRLLALPPLAWLGRISYSVYVWQAFFMLPWSATIRPWLLCIGLPTISLLSYYCIEEPSANLGRRLTLRKMATETPQRTVPWNQSVA